MIVDPVTECYDLNASGHINLHETFPSLEDDLRNYFIRCNKQGVDPIIDFTNEGYGLYANGAWPVIESVAQECGIEMNKLTLCISDMFASYPCNTMPLVNDKWLQVYKPTSEPAVTDRLFKKFGHFVGRVSPDRMAMHVLLSKYQDNMWYSMWYGWDFDDNFFQKVKNYLPRHLDKGAILGECRKVAEQLPQKNTYETPSKDDFYEWPRQVEPLHFYYKNMFVDIVQETDLHTCFTTEKTLRPIIFKTPFLLMAGKGTLQKLKDIGFKTFDYWWSEDYDNFSNRDRMEKILDIVEWISVQYNVDKFKEEMTDILEHNYNHYVNQTWIPMAKEMGVPDSAFGDTRTWE